MFRNLSLAALCLNAASFAAYSAPLPEHGEICTGCHGADGKGQAGIAPMLAGLNVDYMESQLELFSNDKRHNVIMKGMADELSDPALRAEVLQYFAQLPTWEFTDLEQRGDQADISNPYRKLVYQGDWDRNIPACSTCHGASGMGVDKFPRLASQQADYLQNQLHAWKKGTRSGDPLNMMGSIAKKLTDKEIQNLSYYFASLRYEESK